MGRGSSSRSAHSTRWSSPTAAVASSLGRRRGSATECGSSASSPRRRSASARRCWRGNRFRFRSAASPPIRSGRSSVPCRGRSRATSSTRRSSCRTIRSVMPNGRCGTTCDWSSSPVGAAAYAALTAGAFDRAPGERIVVVVCGSNCDPTTVMPRHRVQRDHGLMIALSIAWNLACVSASSALRVAVGDDAAAGDEARRATVGGQLGAAEATAHVPSPARVDPADRAAVPAALEALDRRDQRRSPRRAGSRRAAGVGGERRHELDHGRRRLGQPALGLGCRGAARWRP